MRTVTAAAVFLVLLVFASCGTGSDASRSGDLAVEPCPEEALGGETASLAELIGSAESWASLNAVAVAPFEDMADVDGSVAEAVAYFHSEPAYVAHDIRGELVAGSALPEQALLQRGVAAAVSEWVDEPVGELLVGFTTYQAFALVVDGDDARFIGTCYDELMNPRLQSLADYAVQRDGSAAASSGELVWSLINDPDGEVRDLEVAMHQ